MKSLFSRVGVVSNSETLKFTKLRMRSLVLKIREEEPDDSEFREAYEKYSKQLVLTASNIRTKTNDEIINILKAGAYALKKDMPKFTMTTDLDTKDLDDFLNFDTKTIYKKSSKSFRKLRLGMKFVDGFTRKYYTNIKKDMKADEDSLINMFEVCCISLYLATPKTRMTTTRLFSTYTHASKGAARQFAQNFNMLISAYLFNTYGLKSMKRRCDNTLYLHSSSEGWLSRMVSSLHVAVRNPDIKVVYRSIDPNIQVVNAFYECRDYLLKYTKVKNWFADISNYGSEQLEAYEKVTTIDCSFTSPPYLDLEKYEDTAILKFNKGIDDLRLSYRDEIEIAGNKGSKLVSKLRVGDILADGRTIKKINKTNQCATLYNTARKWDEMFLKPTVTNIYSKTEKKGYLILNVVNNTRHKSMEDSTVDLTKDVGYKIIDKLRLPLIRKPGKGKDGVRLADSKNNYEPIFIFQK